MRVLDDITALMLTFNKARLDETAQCVSNFLQREVQDLLRRKQRDSQTNNTNLLPETVINDLNSTIEPPENETTIDAIDQYDSDTHISDENEDIDGQVTTILDDSITQIGTVYRPPSALNEWIDLVLSMNGSPLNWFKPSSKIFY